MIAQLLITFGPSAIELIQQLVTVWDKPLTKEEVLAILALAKKSYDDYLAAAEAATKP